MADVSSMITVSVREGGDIDFVCTVCDSKETIAIIRSESVFFPFYLGETIQRMLAHYIIAHTESVPGDGTYDRRL